MVRGVQKSVVVVTTAESKWFERAYFVLRDKAGAVPGRKEEMVTEACRILSQCGLTKADGRPRRRLPRALLFFLGALCGALCALAVAFLVGG